MAQRHALSKLRKPPLLTFLTLLPKSAISVRDPLQALAEQCYQSLARNGEAAEKQVLAPSNSHSASWRPWADSSHGGDVGSSSGIACDGGLDWRLSEEQVERIRLLRSLRGLLGEATFEKLQFPAPQAQIPLKADSVKRKRRKKMNKHKQRKLRRRERNKASGGK
ncbi:hypothetical protein KFL_000100560 [Klebsormidium nitens]|uniref:Small ribosomal subunit protein mS38 n=1 Tax=Klebsormidium nitens TaxID=105231 RepID=A0A1Y1HMR8_KLENI|nr:hypothetical protein KFL_000100560 [Klebsormidium nitens]|eukprot:GAQ78291.1 hypothetical protein KFL_000100560 [Klebsormidium nitens]